LSQHVLFKIKTKFNHLAVCVRLCVSMHLKNPHHLKVLTGFGVCTIVLDRCFNRMFSPCVFFCGYAKLHKWSTHLQGIC